MFHYLSSPTPFRLSLLPTVWLDQNRGPNLFASGEMVDLGSGLQRRTNQWHETHPSTHRTDWCTGQSRILPRESELMASAANFTRGLSCQPSGLSQVSNLGP
ncbi:hypothetical protein LIA77_10864 [Sarocladium implicatum]|nr:hypothetical protein LIA77_10864 [Sarocladium implicatum]